MAIYLTSLNSGSNGNCYYIGTATSAVLIDAGISCRETVNRMQQLGLSMKNVKAIFISHEHIDHIKGVATISSKYDLPVFISGKTAGYCPGLKTNPYGELKTDEPIQAGNLTVTAFSKFHDACDPHSFIVSCSGITVGVFTDIGRVCKNVIHHFRQCHAAFLETNYDEIMLEAGSYPLMLKKRIRGGHGHLSNRQALDLFIQHRPTYMSHLLLSHLSKENNNPQLVTNTFSPHAGNTNIVVASRNEASPVFSIEIGGEKRINQNAKQLQLF